MLLLCPDLFFWDSKRRLWIAESLFQLQFQSIKALGEVVNHAIFFFFFFEKEERREEMLDIRKCERSKYNTLCAKFGGDYSTLCQSSRFYCIH